MKIALITIFALALTVVQGYSAGRWHDQKHWFSVPTWFQYENPDQSCPGDDGSGEYCEDAHYFYEGLYGFTRLMELLFHPLLGDRLTWLLISEPGEMWV